MFDLKPQYPSRPGTCPDHLLIDKNHHIAKPDNRAKSHEPNDQNEELPELAHELGCTTRILGLIIKHAGIVMQKSEKYRVIEVKAAFADLYPGQEAATANMLGTVVGVKSSTITALNFMGFLKPCAILAGVKLYTADDYYDARSKYDDEHAAELAAKRSAIKQELAAASVKNKEKGPPKGVRYRRARSPSGIDG